MSDIQVKEERRNYAKIKNKREAFFEISSLDQLRELTNTLILHFKKPCLILLEGDLGAGKTTFVQSLVKELGIDEIVTSPTFTKIHQYLGDNLTVYHLDLYRQIPSIYELEELLQDENIIICIEWADKLRNKAEYKSLLDTNIEKLSIKIELLFNGSRRFKIDFL